MAFNTIKVNDTDTGYVHSIFDVSEYNSGATYADLSAALAAVPQDKRKGGMSIKFIQTDDNKYVQYRLMASSFSTNVSDWQGVDSQLVTGSHNLIESGAVDAEIKKLLPTDVVYDNTILTKTGALKTDGTPSAYTGWPRTDYIEIPTNAIRLTGSHLMSNTAVGATILFYNGSKSLLSAITGVKSIDVDLTSQAYSTAKYVIFNSMQSGTDYNLFEFCFKLSQEYSVPKLREDVDDLKEETDNIKEEVSSMEAVKDITNDIEWTNGYYAAWNGEVGGYDSHISYKSGKAAEINVSEYDEIRFTNAAYQNTYVPYFAYIIGDGNLVDSLNITPYNRSTPYNGTIYTRNYKGYSQLKLKLNILQTGTVVAVKSVLDNRKRIVLNGDSLCNKTGAYLSYLCHAFGYSLLNRVQGGEMIIGNLTRAGGLKIRVKEEFTIPASGPVVIDLESAWRHDDLSYAQTPYNLLGTPRTVFIKGVKGSLTKSSSDVVGMLVYDSSKNKLTTYSENGTYTLPATAAYIRFNTNVNGGGVPHVSINDVAVDVDSVSVIDGYINSSNTLVEDSEYKHTDYISVSGEDSVYIDALAAPTSYVFTREESGNAIKVGVGYEFVDVRANTDKNDIHVWFSGQNGGYDDADEYVNMTDAAARAFDNDFIVISTYTAVSTNILQKCAETRFGNRYLNLRNYMQSDSIYDGLRFGLLTDGTLEPEDWEDELISDGTHPTDKGAYIIAVKIWNKLVELGIVEGDFVESDEYYMELASVDLGYWFNTPENGYVVWPYLESN